jgi:hypothetical protein
MKRGAQIGLSLAVLALTVVIGAYGFSVPLFGTRFYPVRWFFKSKSYKAEVMTSPQPADGTFRHMEWDGWGGFGAGDTVVYLVFDPNDSLARAARSGANGKFPGIPCDVYRVQRFERDWYTVSFYTDTDWEHCI